jgi:hypothetical protein
VTAFSSKNDPTSRSPRPTIRRCPSVFPPLPRIADEDRSRKACIINCSGHRSKATRQKCFTRPFPSRTHIEQPMPECQPKVGTHETITGWRRPFDKKGARGANLEGKAPHRIAHNGPLCTEIYIQHHMHELRGACIKLPMPECHPKVGTHETIIGWRRPFDKKDNRSATPEGKAPTPPPPKSKHPSMFTHTRQLP